MVVDYEAAWIQLQASIAAKSQHGRDALLREMAQLAAEHQVRGELPHLLRLYGVEVHASAETEPAGSSASGGGSSPVRDRRAAAHHRPEGHDVSRADGGRAAA